MKASDLIRNVLDLIDQVNVEEIEDDSDQEQNEEGEQNDRFASIFAMLDAERSGPYSNTPNEVVAPVSAVTTDAGGGVNGPKHPDDIRVKDPRGY